MKRLSTLIIMAGLSIFLLFMCYPTHTLAHPLSVSYSTITHNDSGIELAYSIDILSVTESTDVGLIDRQKLRESQDDINEWIRQKIVLKVDGIKQQGQLTSMELEDRRSEGLTMVRAKYQFSDVKSGQEISLDDSMYTENSPNYTNLLVFKEGKQVSETVLKGRERHWEVILGDPAGVSGRSGSHSGWLDFLLLGAEHILTGYDHLLFLLALLLRKQSFKQYAAIITAFTVAHSITLSMAVMGIVSVPSRWVEAIIALSICFVAVENLFREKISHRALITFLFGLFHGLGFAGILSEMEIPKSHLAVSLISFNVGIELVQITLVLLLLPLLNLWQRSSYQKSGLIAVSTVIALIGAFWSMERLFF
ncbi:HupE/UreJ family protein [Paenibacillus sp. PL91]|uniref:HupE/UreJ family protein n=1 Tax=Paenibacillus sp. PL91 TaxID=2729538 RepID=UPI00145F60A6|nr:HupE/UreJ family protein [Paenibacillus sp. PL91]MBC9201602.1 HupE/UreJ family protein [Paenibacillus sp. PL91]